jgi:hypothetical protein
MSQPAVEQPLEHAAGQLTTQVAKRPAARPRSLANRIMWLVILWCAGFGATFIVVLPFHLLVQWAVHH